MARLNPLETLRAGRMLRAGRLTATVTSLRTGEHITVKAVCKRKTDAGYQKSGYEGATHVFLSVPSSEGYGDKIGAYYPRTGRLFPAIGADPARVWAAQAVLVYACDPVTHPQASILEADACGRCGRELTDPVSIARGIGPECYGQLTGSRHEVRPPAAEVIEAAAYDSGGVQLSLTSA